MNVNKAGVDWLNIKKWLLDKVDELHKAMETPLNIEEYNQARGSILMARELIETVEPTTPPTTEEDQYC